MPTADGRRTGIAVAINCDSTVRAEVRNDFLDGLRVAINNGPNATSLQLIVVPPHFSSRVVDRQDAEWLQQRTRAHFVLAGRVRTRSVEEVSYEILNITALVVHRQLDEQRSVAFAREFAELLPSEARIKSSDSFVGLEFTASWAATVAKYIIGIAYGVSGDLDYAERLFIEVGGAVSTANEGFLIYSKLKERVPVHLASISEERARRARIRWLRTRTDADKEAFIQLYDEYRSRARVDGVWSQIGRQDNFWLHEAVYRFLSDRDVAGAFAALDKVPVKRRTSIWALNAAFLYGYLGELKKATQQYRRALTLGVPLDSFDVVVGQVEPFICEALRREPDRVGLHYCLGFLNWQFKGDITRAVTDFEEFLDSSDPVAFAREHQIAREWIREMSTPNSDRLPEPASPSRGTR